jgi:two-component system, chemotaxis family, protein-glutamate methylesterase/glutaminase
LSTLHCSTSKVRVLVVDDSAFVRRAIIRMFDSSNEISIIDVASDGQMAIELIKKHHPDVVTLDVQMPVLDGISALERIMKECPVPVVMLSSLTGRGGDQTLRALDLGAVDFIDKSTAGGIMDLSTLLKELTSKILVAAKVDLKKLFSQVERVGLCPEQQPGSKLSGSEAVFIGISTGGPPALQAILSAIPVAFNVPIFIVQHMPVGFTASLAERLNRTCAISVKEAEDGEVALPGTAYVAPGGKHLKVKRSPDDHVIRISLDQMPSDTLHRPSVDVLFQSAAECIGDKALAFVLTGMGKDGSVGARAIKEAGGRVFAQSEATSVVFGMPKAVMEAVKVDGVVPLYSVADTMLRMI